MIPFETIPLKVTIAPSVQNSPYVFTIIINFFRSLGLDVITIDGSILPGTYIVFMFVAWGVWHWILMAINSYGALPRIYLKIKEMVYNAHNR